MTHKKFFGHLLYLISLLLILGGLYGISDVIYAQITDSGPHPTAFPATDQPDQLCLTWSDDPQTTQTIQWRCSTDVTAGEVAYYSVDEGEQGQQRVRAERMLLKDAGVTNDPLNHRFTAVLRDLTPGTGYRYCVGGEAGWSDWHEFTTAPAGHPSFSFVYMGDPQVGFEFWGRLLHSAFERHPDAVFYTVAGDNVNRGHHRNEWDDLFNAATGVFDRRPYVPALGNHDYSKQRRPQLYLDLLALMENGPRLLGAEHAYAFHYSNALFVVLDSNASIRIQAEWLEEELKQSDALWKFVIFHHPAYSSKAGRDNKAIREQWGRLFDRYHVDMALQGHDHGYLRTWPMNKGKKVSSPAEGTVYIVSVSGTKLYGSTDLPYAEKVLGNTSTYQHLDIHNEEGKSTLSYRAYTLEGDVVDELIIAK